MNDESWIQFYKQHKEFKITLDFYGGQTRISLEDFIDFIKWNLSHDYSLKPSHTSHIPNCE